ncbi:MAG TPA: PAS domain-containing protein [Candidatus Nanoarchaeia archaeon]|nr:PAS domain-containing protein [Candidatus Nanoarchaeia archaeon]
MHRTLSRQIKKFFGDNIPSSKEWDNFINSISETYAHFDEDRTLIERSMELSSKELGEANEQLKKNASTLSLLLNSTDEGIFGLDLNGNCTFINKSGAKLFGYPYEEILGKHMHSLTHHKKPSGDQYSTNECPIIQSFKTGKGTRNDNEVFWRRDGTAFQTEYSAYPIVDQGTIKGVVVSFTDITKRKMAEFELMKLSSVVGQTTDSIMMTDKDGKIEYVNPAFEKLTGYSSSEAVGQNPRILKSGKQDTAFYKALWDTILSGKTFHSEFVNKKKNGSLYHEEKIIVPVRDNQGNIRNFVSSGRDISERKAKEEEIKLKSDELERFNKFAVGRELKMVELKKRIHELEDELKKAAVK